MQEKLHNEDSLFLLFIRCYWGSIMKISWMKHAAHMRKMKNELKTFVGKPEGKKQLGR
jgi:hypothetical protein